MNKISILNSLFRHLLLFISITIGTPIVEFSDAYTSEITSDTSKECKPAIYSGNESTFALKRSGADQFVLSVEIGDQTFDLLVDTGSNALLVFEDKICESNKNRVRRSSSPIKMTDIPVSKSYAATLRSGYLATAPVRIGAYYAPDMNIMVIETPDSQNDPSLTAKGADGIIGLRRAPGLTFLESSNVDLDAPLSNLSPSVSSFELNLPATGSAFLSLNNKPLLNSSNPAFVFKAKTVSIKDSNEPVSKSYSDLQIPFRAKSSYGEASDSTLDVLIDTGAVSKLVLDTEVAVRLGYNPDTETWNIPDSEYIEFNLIGASHTIDIKPRFKVSEIKVAPYSLMGISFEAVLGISRWHEYVVGFDFVDYEDGGPDGTISLLQRADIESANTNKPQLPKSFVNLSGINQLGDDRFPVSDTSGSLIVFESDRNGGSGGFDLYSYKMSEGVAALIPNLNTSANEISPSISSDGRYLLFSSDREGGKGEYDIYLYDFTSKEIYSLDMFNSDLDDLSPLVSPDGQFVAFISNRSGGAGGTDIYLYDLNSSAFVNLDEINTAADEIEPKFGFGGRYLTWSANGDVFIYDISSQKKIYLPKGYNQINTDAVEHSPSVSSDGRYLALQSNRNNLNTGLSNRDIFVFDLNHMLPVALTAINSSYDDAFPCFTGDGRYILFHSNRSEGVGGLDIFMFDLDSSQDTSASEKQYETIALSKTGDGLFTVPVMINGEKKDLLLDTTLSAMILFSDKTGISPSNDTVSLNLNQGELTGRTAAVSLSLGGYTAQNFNAVMIDSAYYHLDGQNGIDAKSFDGVIGLQKFRSSGSVNGLADVPLKELVPRISKIELNLDPFGTPGLSLNQMPVIGKTGDEHLLISGLNYGYVDKDDPYTKSFSDIRIPFGMVSHDKNGSRTILNKTLNRPSSSRPKNSTVKAIEDYKSLFQDEIFLAAGTAFKETIILDKSTAQYLGYDIDQNSWGTVTDIDLFLYPYGSDGMVTLAAAVPVKTIKVVDLAAKGENYDAVVGLNYWNNFVLGFDEVDYQSGGPSAVTFLLNRNDAFLPKDDVSDRDVKDRRFISLPGLNSSGDDSFGDISQDGKTIVFQSSRNGNPDIFVYQIDKGLLSLPNLNSDVLDIEPAIRADGKVIAFQSNRNGTFDIFLYNIDTATFEELPGLNSETEDEVSPALSSDGQWLSFTRNIIDSDYPPHSDIVLYYLAEKREIYPLNAVWLNTEGYECNPAINSDEYLIGFEGVLRADNIGGSQDIFIFDTLAQHLRDFPYGINSSYYDARPSLSPDASFMAFHSDRNNPELASVGQDIFLLDLSSEEFIHLPGINSYFEDSAPAITNNAQFVLFHSARAGGEGGYDIYLYKRDIEPNSNYLVEESFAEDGYVKTNEGVPAPNITVTATSGDGKEIASAITNEQGFFVLTIPADTKLPISYTASDSSLVVHTDDVGDDTYVPNFKAGDLSFSQVWIEDTAQTGLFTTVKFDIETTQPAYNVHVNIYLKAGNPSEININKGINFNPDYKLTGVLIDKLGQAGSTPEPITISQSDISTTITYAPDSQNKKAHVEHKFIVPREIADGIYTAVFAINVLDVNPKDDDIQGESTEDSFNNYLIASASTIIGTPDKPNLRILSAKLDSNSFELPNGRPDITFVPDNHDLNLNLEVESMAEDTTLPVDIIFELEVDDKRYPLSFFDVDGKGLPLKNNRQTYPVVCSGTDGAGSSGADGCASLFRQRQTGKTYHLYIDDAAYDLLSIRSADSVCSLVITMDPEHAIEEYLDNRADNVVKIPVMFLKPQDNKLLKRSGTARDGISQNSLFDVNGSNQYGNDNFATGYNFNAALTYWESSYEGITCPYRAHFDGNDNDIWAKIFGYTVTVLAVDAEFDFNGDTPLDAYFKYNVSILEGDTVWSDNRVLRDYFKDADEISLWDTKDKNGNEKYSKDKEKKWTKRFTVGPVPMSVTGGLTGEIGIRAEVKYAKGNKFILEGGPYASLNGMLELGAVDIYVASVGVGTDLKLIEVFLKLTPRVQIVPSFPVAIFRFDAPIVLSTLDGNAYLYAEIDYLISSKRWKYTIIEWDGLSYDIHFFPQQFTAWGLANSFNAYYYNGTSWGEDGVQPLNSINEGIIYHEWGSENPYGTSDSFSVKWEGYFNFNKTDKYVWGDDGTTFNGDYTFYKDSDELMSVWIDMNDNEDEDSGEAVFTDSAGIANTTVSVPTGYHRVEVKYTDTSGDAEAKLSIRQKNQFGAWYFDNKNLSGLPVYYETTEEINYDWQDTIPRDKVGKKDEFSVLWEGDFDFPISSDYIFSATADDGIRIYVDGSIVVDRWSGAAGVGRTEVTTYITSGTHTVRVEYFENTGAALAKVLWGPKNTFTEKYYTNTSFSGTPAITNESLYFNNNEFNKSWPNASSGHSSKFEGYFYFTAGDYDFITLQDDGMKVWVDNDLIFSHWDATSLKAQIHKKSVTEGWHRIRMDYVNYGGPGFAVVRWVEHKDNEWTVTYYYNGLPRDILKKSLDTSGDAGSGFELAWGNGAPDTTVNNAVGSDNFAVEWEGDLDFEAAPYLFTLFADDRMKLWIDGVQVMTQTLGSHSAEAIPMSARKYHIKVRFEEDGGYAAASAKWHKIEKNVFYSQCFKNTEVKNDGPNYTQWGSSIDKNWGTGGECQNDNFSMRWVGVFEFPEDGYYQFNAGADDRVYIYIDGQKVLNGDTCCGPHKSSNYIMGGYHSVRVEYVEYGGNAALDVNWSKWNPNKSEVLKRSYLRNEESLNTGEYLESDNKKCFALMQGDGSFVVYKRTTDGGAQPIWSSGVKGNDNYFALMQGDGNFVIYKGLGSNVKPIWSTGVKGNGDYFAIMQGDGNFVVYKGTGPGDNQGYQWGTQSQL
ncbi:MAG: PD40 domain-containing protein [Desulfamplus sp.]|nr:PD40 domain-containing protein [Desulfamplus sp.]